MMTSPILIIDDLQDKLMVFATVLEPLAQEVVLVRSGREALRVLLEREFAVILLDVNMPDIDGFETAALIRQHKRSAHTPIIFITAYADEMQTARGYSLGAVDYILSPVVPEVLRSKVQVFVQLHAMQQQVRRQADAQAALIAADAARRAAEDNDRRSIFLSQAGRVLNRSLQVDEALRALGHLLVPELVAYAAISSLDDELPDAPVRLAIRQPGRSAPTLDVRAESALDGGVRAALQAALRDKARIDLSAQAVAALPALVPGRTTTAAAALPLVNGERLLGAVFVAWIDGDAPLAGGSGSVLEALMTHAAAALENARLYGSLQREIVQRRAVEERLVEASQRKDEFLAMLAHELRNPLAPIRNAVEIIEKVAAGNDKIDWAAGIMVRQLRHLTQLIDELLDVARISQGKIVLTRERVDLNAVVAHSVETAQPMLAANGQHISVTPFSDSTWLSGDFARLSQIVTNLLHNACKYSPRDTSVRLVARIEDHRAVIEVSDEGIGIDADLLPRVFDLFTQGRRGLDRAQGGLGIGLTLSQRMAQMHGGALEATSPGAGRGSTFTLRLPYVGLVQPVPVPVPADRATPHVTPGRVLIVDDNLDAAQSFAAFVEIAGYQVRIAADGLQALEAAAEFGPDAVVLDIGLPRLDGYEVARRLRQLEGLRDVVLIAVTGYGRAADRERAMAAGFDAHFVKPVEPSALLASIAERLSARPAPVAVANEPAR